MRKVEPPRKVAPPSPPASLVTVVIRSLGRPHLASALASVARQTHREIEVLMVDATGGKHPSMADRCGDFPLRFLCGSRTLSRPEAANRGLDHARGAWIIFLDDDDFFEPGHIASLLKTAMENQTVVAYAGTRMLDGNDQAIGELNERYSRLKLCAGNFMQMGAVLFHRSLLQQGCRFDERMLLYQDWDFWLQLSRFSHFAHAAEITNNWRIHTGESGAGVGENANLVLQAEFTAKVKDKWQPHHDRLIEFVHNTVRRSNQQISTGRANRAVKWLRRALTAMPNDPTLTNLLGLAKYKTGDLTGAWHALDDAHALLPENDAIGRNLVQVEKLRRTRRSK